MEESQTIAGGWSITCADGRTDKANARRMADMHGETVSWCEPHGKWLIWCGTHHIVDQQRAVRQKATDVVEQVWLEASEHIREQGSKDLLAFAKYTASAKGINAMLELFKDEPGIPIMPSRLDSDPWFFNCENGTVDLKTGKRLDHNRLNFITKLCPLQYIITGSAKCELWQKSINLIFGGNANLIGYFRRLCGYALVGEVTEHILPILHGVGSNGKSLVMETLLDVFGPDYAGKASTELLLESNGNQHPTSKAALHGKRLIVCNESDSHRRLAEATVKELSGGDTITARRMREDEWSYKPSHTPFMVTNHKPLVTGTDHGLWRRLPLVPFEHRFWDADKGETGPEEYRADKYLKGKLKVEYPGILKWLVAACLEWQREGLGMPTEVATATAGYRESMDVLATFLGECCILDANIGCKASDLRKTYEKWCEENGEKPINGRRFGEQLVERGVTKRISNGTWYSGIGIAAGF